jgi:hypothetical protein
VQQLQRLDVIGQITSGVALGFYALDDLNRTQATAGGRSGPTLELKLSATNAHS